MWENRLLINRGRKCLLKDVSAAVHHPEPDHGLYMLVMSTIFKHVSQLKFSEFVVM